MQNFLKPCGIFFDLKIAFTVDLGSIISTGNWPSFLAASMSMSLWGLEALVTTSFLMKILLSVPNISSKVWLRNGTIGESA